MQVLISDWKEECTCLWCSKEKECVTVTIDGGFLRAAALCWHCLQNAVRVRCRQSAPASGDSGRGGNAGNTNGITDTSGNRQIRSGRPTEDG
ncbi:MAG: hypothetical protein R3C59_09775 [Planctomycetaceae bacterium]